MITPEEPGSGGAPQPGPWRPPRRRTAARRRRPAIQPAAVRAALPDWDALDGAGLHAAWTDLVSWVTWLHDRYELSTEERLPHCWAEHSGLVEELAALKAWHDEIYGSDQPSGQAARYWHAELRQTITAALTFYASGCRAGHRAGTPATPQLRERWSAATPPGIPAPAASTTPSGYLPGAAMAAHLSAGHATTLSDTITGYLRHDRSWWTAADGGWQRVSDAAVTTLLDHHAQIMARADQAVRRAAATRQAGG